MRFLYGTIVGSIITGIIITAIIFSIVKQYNSTISSLEEDIDKAYDRGYRRGEMLTELNCSDRISQTILTKDLQCMSEKTGLWNEIRVLTDEISYLKESKPLFLEIAEEVAQAHNYSIPGYVCEHFSRDLVRELKKNDYDAETKIVRVDCDSGLLDKYSCEYYNGIHVVVKLVTYIESVTGKLIEPDYYCDYGLC